MPGRFILCEKKGEWGTALRWAAGDVPLRIYETRTLWDCRQELGQFPASFLVLEATGGNLEGVFHLLSEAHLHYSLARIVVVGKRPLRSWEHLLREAGALHVAFSPRRLDAIIRMAYRHLGPPEQPHLSLLDSVRSRMPWPTE